MMHIFLLVCIALIVSASQIQALPGCIAQRSPPGLNVCLTSGGFLLPGQHVKTLDCKVCTCHPNLVLACCSAGPHFVRYPPTCIVRRDPFGCEKLVFRRRPWQHCTDGPVSAVG